MGEIFWGGGGFGDGMGSDVIANNAKKRPLDDARGTVAGKRKTRWGNQRAETQS